MSWRNPTNVKEHYMKKTIFGLLLTMLMVFSIVTVETSHAKGRNPISELTGKVWVDSDMSTKLALIYGVECAITMEYLTAKHKAEKNGESTEHTKIVESLNAFPESWILVFSDVERQDIVNDIDKWYAENPEKIELPVFKVLWYNIMEPKLESKN